MVVVVISVVVVSSSTGTEDMVLLSPICLAAEDEVVVSSPGDMAVAVDSLCLSPGTACVGLVVVPEGSKGSHLYFDISRKQSPFCS